MKETEPKSYYGNLITEIGHLFVNKPYREGSLENRNKEKLTVTVSVFDCMTFVETVLALTRCAFSERLTPGEFKHNLKRIRYRQGKISGYFSRLHYFSDWLNDSEKKKILINISRSLGGKPQRKKINFITSHRELYPALENKAQFNRMLAVEKNLSRKNIYIIDKDKINKQTAKIKNGDVIAFATNQEGLDVAHVGFAFWQGKSLRLLHASKKEGAVIISKKTLTTYLKSNKKFTGIIVARFSRHYKNIKLVAE